MKRRNGWFKKARKKFVNKRVFSWDFSNYRERYNYMIEAIEGQGMKLRYIDKDKNYQIINTISNLGFIEGFWKAREYAKNHNDIWCFSFDKIISI